MLRSLPFLFFLGAAALLGGGCVMSLSPPEHRASQYSTQFDSYDAPTQERLRDATIAIGDDRTAVYIALGKPQRRRIGYGRNPANSATVLLEYWDYSGYPSGLREGQFTLLNNGGFASPLGTSAHGRVTIEFADSLVRHYSHDPNQNVPDRGSWQMFVPDDPHRLQP